MAGSSSPRLDDNDCLRLPATSSPRTRGAEKKESTDLRLSQPCPPYVTPSSISSFGRRLNGVHTAENKFLKNTGANRFCQSSASPPDEQVTITGVRRQSGAKSQVRTHLNCGIAGTVICGGGNGAILEEFSIPLGSAAALFSPPELAGPKGIPLIARCPAPAAPAIWANEAAGVARRRNARTILAGLLDIRKLRDSRSAQLNAI
jgi:hypothetical protein